MRPLTEEEQQALEKGLRSKDAFVLRRCQIRLARARGARAPRIAAQVGCDDQTVLNALHACRNAAGRSSLRKKCSRAHRTRVVFAPEQAERLRALPHRRPREFGQPTSRWTRALTAAVSVAEGIVPTRVA